MEPLSWGWSTLFQVASALAIAAYFVVLSRSVQRAEMNAWAAAWLSNLAAIAIAISSGMLQQKSAALSAFLGALHVFAKMQFVVLLVAGATRFAFDKPRPVLHGPLSIAIAAFSLLVAVAIGSLDRVGMIQSVTMGAILFAGAIVVSRLKMPAWGWLATGFVLRAVLSAFETDAYAIHSALGDTAGPPRLAGFLAAHATFDTCAEWIIALACASSVRKLRQQGT